MSTEGNLKLQQDRWLSDDTNWRLGIFYFNPSDKRVIVPKRNKLLGWTLNFAKPVVYIILLLVVVVLFIL